MKTIFSTLVALGVLAGAAHAQYTNPFGDFSEALPRSASYEQALPRVSNDDFRQALPRTSATFPDIVIATP
jgi:hypothetical protein